MAQTFLASEPLAAAAQATPELGPVAALLADARSAGRTHLLETEGLAVVRALGIGAPCHRLVSGSRAVSGLDLSLLPGERVVVKLLSSTLLHKSDVGGVAVVARERDAVARAIQDMERRIPAADVAGFMVAEYIPHDPGLGGELLLGMRWTDDFGPVVTLGLGGIHTELLAASLRPERDVAIVSPVLASPDRIAAALAGKLATRLLIEPLRGRPARCDMQALRSLLLPALDFAAAHMPHAIAELEINPLVLRPSGPVALDALVRLGGGAPPEGPAESARPIDKIGRLLAPESAAVVGVSAKGSNPGRIILRNLLSADFDAARLYVVKPGSESIDGCRCVPDIASLPERVDLLVLAIDAAQVPAALAEATAHRRAESVIVIPGGLGERSGSETAVAELRAGLAAARQTAWRGPVVNGGNCLGIRSVPGRYNTLFIPQHKLRFPAVPAAPLALLSQSGAFAIARAGGLATLNPRYLVSYGNQLDLTIGDYLTYLEGDPEVEVFACYVEGFRPLDGRRFLDAAARITASGRPVILYRAGRTPAGAQATASHTASIAGDYAVTRELAATAGVVLADSLAEFEDLVRLFCLLRGKRVDGWGLGAMSNAGFECVALADRLGRFQLPAFAAATSRRLNDLLASRRLAAILEVHNPLDVSPILDDEGWEVAVAAVLDDPAVDVGLFGCVPLTGALSTVAPGAGHCEDVGRPGAVADRLGRLFAASRKAWVAVVDGGGLYDPFADLLAAHGVPVFRTMDRAARTFERYCAWRLRPPLT